MYHHRYWLCALTVRWLFPLEFILLIWALYGFTCSWVSPRWFVFASSCCLEMPPTQAVWGFSDYMGSMNSGHKPLWVLLPILGGYFCFLLSISGKFHMGKPHSRFTSSSFWHRRQSPLENQLHEEFSVRFLTLARPMALLSFPHAAMRMDAEGLQDLAKLPRIKACGTHCITGF